MKPSDTLARLRARSVEAGRFVLALDREWAERLTEAYAKVRRIEALADASVDDQLADAKGEVAELEAKAGDNVIVFRFRRMAKPEYEELLAAHPPTEAQRKAQDDAGLQPWQRKVWNEETFEPALVHKVLIEPKLSIDEVCEMLRSVGDTPLLSMGEARQMADAAVAAALSPPVRVPEELRLP